MKRLADIFLAWLIPIALMAQDQVNMNFGNPTAEEMQMTTYAEDPDAEAVVLCRLTDVEYIGELVIYNEKCRIKVLKPSGARFAHVAIPYMQVGDRPSGTAESRWARLSQTIKSGYQNLQANTVMTEEAFGKYIEENVEQLKATAYNLSDGKVEKTTLNSGAVKKVRIDDDNWQMTFTVPNVREGTVIEYEYTLNSEFSYHLHDWYAQTEIPVAYARLDMNVPRSFGFNFEEHGVQKLEHYRKADAIRQLQTGNNMTPKTINTIHFIYTGRNLKALPGESYVWNMNDYRAGVTAELKNYAVSGALLLEHASQWSQIDKMLMEDFGFDTQMSEHSPLRDEIEKANINGIRDEEQKAAAICKLVMERVKWNNKYDLIPRKSKETLKRGEGTNADINMLLIQTLRDAGLEAVPVVLRQRNLGTLPYKFPTISKLTTYIVGIMLSNGNNVYVDASSVGGWLNVLPESLLVERARILTKKIMNPWVNLQKVSKSKITTVIDAVLGSNGRLEGTEKTTYQGLAAMKYRQKKGMTSEFAPEVKEEVKFAKQGTMKLGVIRINPFHTLPMKDNPFAIGKRLVPVEFPSESSHQVIINLTLPQGYQLDNSDRLLTIATTDKGVDGQIGTTSTEDGKVQMTYKMDINRVSHSEEVYDSLRYLFDMFTQYSNKKMTVINPQIANTNYYKMISTELKEQMLEWTGRMPSESLEEYQLRVNDKTREEHSKMLEYQITARIASELIENPAIQVGDYNSSMKKIAMNVGPLPTIYLDVEKTEVDAFYQNDKLELHHPLYQMKTDNTLEIVYAEIYNAENGKTYVFDNRNAMPLTALEEDPDFVPLDIIRRSNMEETALQVIKDEMISTAPKKMVVSDKTHISVSTGVSAALDQNGNKRMDYHIEFNYEVEEAFSARDDFKPGHYRTEESKAAMLMLQIMRNAFEKDFSKYIIEGKQVRITFKGTADAFPVTKKISYNGKYGEYENTPVIYQDGSSGSLSLNSREGITNNDQLAFARALGVKKYIDKTLTAFNEMNRDDEYRIEVFEKQGSKFRRISVTCTFFDAF